MQTRKLKEVDGPSSRLIYITHNPTGELIKVFARYLKVFRRRFRK